MKEPDHDLEYHDKKFYFDILYITLYPRYPPKFFCYTNSSYQKFLISSYWAGHQYTDNSLCLFTNDSGESKWDFNYRLDKVLEKAPEQARSAIERAMTVSVKGHEKATEALRMKGVLSEVSKGASLPVEIPQAT